jgi:hypothetical protein
MTPLVSLVLKCVLFVTALFHFVQVFAMVKFTEFLKPDYACREPWTPEYELGKATRLGLIMFVVGSGILVLINLSEIAQGGLLPISLCVLLSSVFGYRWFLQMFRFSKLLCVGAPRKAHWYLVVGSGGACLSYAICAFILVMT